MSKVQVPQESVKVVIEALKVKAQALWQKYQSAREDLAAVEAYHNNVRNTQSARMLDRVKAEHDQQRATLRGVLILIYDLKGEGDWGGLWLETMIQNLGIGSL